MDLSVPGDKSLTQRALIFAALADGESRLSGLLWGGDAESTAGALRSLGVKIPDLPTDGSEISVQGVGLQGLQAPSADLDFGNSGTGARLLLGVLAGSGLSARVTGDASLRTRPMARVIDPLRAMGAQFELLAGTPNLPVEVQGIHPLRPVDWTTPVASAQVKSSILLAGLTGQAFVLITEPRTSRDHTERLLNATGASVVSHATEGGWRVELRDPPARLDPLDFRVPGDMSSAAFVFAVAALRPADQEPVTVRGVGLNPTRTAFLDVLERMGARVNVELRSSAGSEPVGDVTVSGGDLRGTTVSGFEIPSLIDELPLVAVLGARAAGETRIADAAELRAKESDRIAALVTNLRSLGAEVEEQPDGLVVSGSDRPLSGSVRAFGDHRIAMSFATLATAESCEIEIEERGVTAVSFPGFWTMVDKLTRGRG